jgi:hypothetical protein
MTTTINDLLESEGKTIMVNQYVGKVKSVTSQNESVAVTVNTCNSGTMTFVVSDQDCKSGNVEVLSV